MAKAKTYGMGWKNESLRHSNAKRFGHAGGLYSQLSYKQLKTRGINLNPNKDADKDGVKNSLDCKPLNKYKQDDEPVKEIDTIIADAEREKKREQAKERGRKVGEFFKKTSEKISEAEKNYMEKRKQAQEKSRERHLSELNQNLKNKVESEEDIDVKTLSENELHSLAVLEGDSIFGNNKYEKELKRRINSNDELNTDLIIERNESKIEQSERLTKYASKKKEKGFFEGLI